MAQTVYQSVKTLGTQNAIATRLARAASGDLTEGGAIDTREALTFIVSFIKLRFIPGKLADGALTGAQQRKLVKLLVPWEKAASVDDPTDAFKAAMAIAGTSSNMATIKDQIGVVFAPVLAMAPDREPAVRILEHAATWFAAGGFPSLAEVMALAADTSAMTEGIFGALAAGVAAVVDQKVDDVKTMAAGGIEAARVAGTSIKEAVAEDVAQAEAAVTGGLAVVKAAAADVKQGLESGLADAKQDLQALADSGASKLQAQYAALEALAAKAKAAAGAQREELMAKLQVAASTFEAGIARVKAAGTAAQQAMAASLEVSLNRVKAMGQAAREVAAQIPQLVETAIAERVGDVRQLYGQAQQLIADVKRDPCQFATGPSAFMCRTATGTGGSTLAWVLIGVPVALLALWLLFKSASASKAVAGLRALSVA